ncbi:MAG: ABC transporter permease [Clostridiaceae bacterium]|jgi:cell division transport system permease protein|nr:permease-like cell division protein FtsX [Oscillospiraceae bacterium]NLO63092.1 ABC transporter permease [Clostridiaceae bacterium]
MSVRAFFNSVREGFKGIVRHPLVTVASVTTILLMLLLMASFFIFSANARAIMKKVGQQPPIEVYMRLSSLEEERASVRSFLDANPGVILSYRQMTPEENYNRFRENLGTSASILDDFDYNTYLPHTFSVQLIDPAYAGEVVMRLQAIPGVNKVLQESRVMEFLSTATKWVNMGTLVAFAVLFLIALFIISNMVRISVYSRSAEIFIMKFVGATPGYIRLPYIVEGAIVGFFSAVLAWTIAHLAYSRLFDMMMKDVSGTSYYSLVPVGSLTYWVALICVALGVFIGASGSGIAVRKYIKV